jgi:hypothetical protein
MSLFTVRSLFERIYLGEDGQPVVTLAEPREHSHPPRLLSRVFE